MSMQNLIIYKFIPLYHILEELSLDLNFKISFIDSESSLRKEVKNHHNYLIASIKKYPEFSNQFVLENKPTKIFIFEFFFINLSRIKKSFSFKATHPAVGL